MCILPRVLPETKEDDPGCGRATGSGNRPAKRTGETGYYYANYFDGCLIGKGRK